ncbi:radical SAM protein [Campylobacter jejuni]|nr:radical SAM protein [Campylobacter jejuni]
MKELYIKNLCIEITRRCNMRCGHCMRGDAEAVDIPLRHISNLLRHVRHIHHFNITGGEPSLNVRAIRHILGRVRAYDITVNDFYIVTNGSVTSRSREFIEACAALYEYQQEKEQGPGSGHMLEMSDDRFHDPAEHAATFAALSPYPFFGVRGQARHVFLFREGRCKEGFPNPIHEIYLTGENYVYGDLVLNAEGMILSNGDLSYARQREHALCPCGKLMQYLRMTLKKREKERLYE